MATNPEKFIKNGAESLFKRLTGNLTASFSGVDQALSQIGSNYSASKTKDTGGDTFVDAMTEFERRQFGDDEPRAPDEPAKPVSEELANEGAAQLVYPADLPHDFRFDMEFMDYKRPTPGSKATVERSMFISLPLPRELYDNKKIQYSVDELGLVGAIVDSLSVAASGGDEGGQGRRVATDAARYGTMATGGAMAAKGGSKFTRLLGGVVAAGLAGEGIKNAASQLTGAQLNPNLSVTFRGPSLRDFTFTWEFAPHSAEESKTLRKILNEIQARSLPSMTYKGDVGILTYPQMVQINLQPETFEFKKCVVQGININYAPGGAPSYFHGTKEPTLIAMTLSLTELEYFLSEDYNGASGKGLNSDIGEIAEGLWDQFKDITGLNGEEDTTENE